MADSEEEYERRRKDKLLRLDRTEIISMTRRVPSNDEVKARRDEWGGSGNDRIVLFSRNGGGKSPSPAKPNSWQIWNQGGNKHSDGGTENDPSSAHPPVHIDVFQEREGGGGMRVGRDFQAKVPNVIPEAERNVQAENDRALLVWKPTEKLTDDEIETYISMAKERFQYTGEQALGLLYWHRYDIQRATQDLGNFTPHPEEWTIEDKVLFEQAFQFHGKSFDKIRQMLPDKSMSSLIRYYYNWKKHKNKSSVMDRQVKKLSQEDEDSVPAPGSNGSGVMSLQNNNINNLHHPHSIGMLQDSFHSESDDEVMILEHG
ncbi:unnamed protein product [Orchesella dallaii]|uniref:REST corepressor n=1 Tax=Orchesella dallaii TaxID=48710 RepID=A0ABP1QKE4_9HEXA